MKTKMKTNANTKTTQEKLITLAFYTVIALGTVILALLFIFPTKDTHEETMAAYNAVEGSVSAFVYDDRLLATGGSVELDGNDMALLGQRNRRSGANFTEDEIRRLKRLREQFPENTLIPRAKSAAEARAEKAEAEQYEKMKQRFSRKQASREDIDRYFDRQLQTLNDWNQLLEFVVNDENWSPKVKAKYGRMLAHTPKLRARIEKQRTQMLALNGVGGQ